MSRTRSSQGIHHFSDGARILTHSLLRLHLPQECAIAGPSAAWRKLWRKTSRGVPKEVQKTGGSPEREVAVGLKAYMAAEVGVPPVPVLRTSFYQFVALVVFDP